MTSHEGVLSGSEAEVIVPNSPVRRSQRDAPPPLIPECFCGERVCERNRDGGSGFTESLTELILQEGLKQRHVFIKSLNKAA